MKRLGPILLLAAAIAAAVAILVIENPMRSRVDDATDEMFSKEFSIAAIDRVEISQLLDGVELKRDGERWLARELAPPLKRELLEREGRSEPEGAWVRADRVRVNSSLGIFGGLSRGIVVSSNEDKRPLYHVESTGLRVKLIGKDGEVLDDVIVGMNGPDFASSYVRRADENDVLLVPRTLTGVFSPVLSDWRERKIWILKPEDIAEISVDSKGGSFDALRDGEGWKLASSNEAIDGSAMERIAKELSSARAEGFLSDRDRVGEKLLTLAILQTDGEKLELTVYEEKDDGPFPARLDGVDETYLLSKKFVESIPRKPPAESKR